MSTPMIGLQQLARRHGIQTSFFDVDRVRRMAAPESLLLTLRALGVPVARLVDVPSALRRQEELQARPGLEPVHVAWNGQLDSLEGRLPEGSMFCQLVLEGGDRIEWKSLTERTHAHDGRVFTRLSLREPLPLGYHRLEVRAGGQVFETLVIASPWHAYLPEQRRSWGVFLPLYALRSDRRKCLSDYTDLERFARWTGELGGSYLGTLPLLATFLASPFEPSPYAPISRLFWNDLFIDTARLPGVERNPESEEIEREAGRCREGDLVDYARMASLQRKLIGAAAQRFFNVGGDRDPGFRTFLDHHPAARDYARFRANCDARRQGWSLWPERMRHGDLHPGDFDETAERYHLFAAWVAEDQLARSTASELRASAALYLDLPLGVHRDGYDTWRMHDLFAHDIFAGAPPDAFFRNGQNWGFPPLHPIALRADGYRYFIDCLRNHLRHAGALRIDHVMGLQRLFWIPQGLEPAQGVYVRYRLDEMLAILTLESMRHQALIIGEDLGTVSREMRSAMSRHRIQRMWVLQFEASPDRRVPLPPVPRSVVASLNTHDMPTFAAYWDALDLNDRRQLGHLSDPQAANESTRRERLRRRIVQQLRPRAGSGRTDDASANGEIPASAIIGPLLKHLAASPARILLVNLEDLWLEPRAQNVPGTSTERPNWRRQARYTLEGIQNDPQVRQALAMIAKRRNHRGDHG